MVWLEAIVGTPVKGASFSLGTPSILKRFETLANEVAMLGSQLIDQPENSGGSSLDRVLKSLRAKFDSVHANVVFVSVHY